MVAQSEPMQMQTPPGPRAYLVSHGTYAVVFEEGSGKMLGFIPGKGLGNAMMQLAKSANEWHHNGK